MVLLSGVAVLLMMGGEAVRRSGRRLEGKALQWVAREYIVP
jgi:hypothetical protein